MQFVEFVVIEQAADITEWDRAMDAVDSLKFVFVDSLNLGSTRKLGLKFMEF